VQPPRSENMVATLRKSVKLGIQIRCDLGHQAVELRSPVGVLDLTNVFAQCAFQFIDGRKVFLRKLKTSPVRIEQPFERGRESQQVPVAMPAIDLCDLAVEIGRRIVDNELAVERIVQSCRGTRQR